jgi:hypothetical protein
MFIFVRHAIIFCGVALVLALVADVVQFLTLLIWAHISGSGIGFFAKRSGWIGIFALWWVISFLVALPLASRFSGLRFRLF